MIVFAELVTDQFLNIPRIYTAIAQWLSCLLFIMGNKRKFDNKKSALISFIFLVVLILFHYWADSWSINFWIFGMISSVLIMFGFILAITKINWLQAGYITVTAFIVSEFAASLEWQMEYFSINFFNNKFFDILLFSPISNYHLRVSLFVIIIFTLIFYSMFRMELRYLNNRKVQEINPNDLFSVLLIGISVFAISNISFLDINTPITSDSPSEMFYIRTLVDFVGVIILYSQREFKYSTQKSMEVYTMKSLMEKQFEQFNISKESVDIINQKYHDLKHHINILRVETDYDKKMHHLDLLEESINLYSVNYHTGNRILDIILNSKNDVIRQNKINFTCVADGSLLDCFESVDIVSIFSNALDNAIESLKDIKDYDKRLMKLTIYSKSDLVMIKLENYYQNILKYENGNLISTKGDSLYHGYGIKSIKSTVEKYSGSITIDTNDNWFSVLILFPKL